MDDLISREKLKRKFCGHCVDYGKCKEECFDLRIINSMPTAEKKGRWIVSDGRVVCSECYNANIETNYCPNCGARMEE